MNRLAGGLGDAGAAISSSGDSGTAKTITVAL